MVPSGSAGRRLLDEITPCGRRIIGKAPTLRLFKRGESVMRRPFLRRPIQAIVILILIFLCVSKRETLAQIAWVFAAASVLTLVLSPACTLLERKGFALRRPPPSAISGLVLLAVLALSPFIPYLFASTADLIRRIIPTLFALTQRSRDILRPSISA